MTKMNSHLLEFSAPLTEVMLMKITKKIFNEIKINGIERETFEDITSELEGHTIFSSSTFKSDGYEMYFYLDGKEVSGFEQHFKSLLNSKQQEEPEVVLKKTKSNRNTHYIYMERFYKGNSYQCRIKNDFNLDKLRIFFPRDLLIGDKIISGFDLMYDGNDFDCDSINFSGEELYLIDSAGQKFEITIYD